MKIILLCLLLFMFGTASGWGPGDFEKYGPMYMSLRYVKCDHSRDLQLDVSLIDVYFYDFSKNFTGAYGIKDAAKQILSIPKLDKNRKFIIFNPGFRSEITKKTEEKIRDTFRNYPNSYLIIFDHSEYTNDKQGSKKKSYERSVRHVYYIGKEIGIMLSDLKRGGISPKQMHCIGHSLGSQMLAHTGETFINITGEKIVRITALDPAGPCFSNSLIQEQIRSGVAEYVEVYHCNAGMLGTTSVLGDIDFFINKNGAVQPNCRTPYIPGVFDSTKAARCNHKTCINVYTATVDHPEMFLAHNCDTYKEYKNGACSRNNVTIAGFWNPGNATGVYYFSTKDFDV
ncbi:pancreatic lipase-related protein 2 [Amyelois transitella]|uniref:pancreatic lipase-related protein 2 n=1 Tax=Amyelois transitella TaxID=680683 RepID=UPI00067AB1D5|nr:pancreatic lipase-related protein 2 [Amyelois transitella]